MKFVLIETTKNESVYLNLEKVLFYTEGKRGVSIFMEDGTIFDIAIALQEWNAYLQQRGISTYNAIET